MCRIYGAFSFHLTFDVYRHLLLALIPVHNLGLNSLSEPSRLSSTLVHKPLIPFLPSYHVLSLFLQTQLIANQIPLNSILRVPGCFSFAIVSSLVNNKHHRSFQPLFIMSKSVVITGANRGLGLGLVKEVSKDISFDHFPKLKKKTLYAH